MLVFFDEFGKIWVVFEVVGEFLYCVEFVFVYFEFGWFLWVV